MKYPNCAEELAEGKSFCSGCGNKVETGQSSTNPRHCGDCGAVLDDGKEFCGECGVKVSVSNDKPRTSSPENPSQPATTPSADNKSIKEFKFYRLGYKGRGGLGGPTGMKNFCTIATVGQSTLKLLVCRGFTLGGDPVKPQVKEFAYSEINSIHLKKKTSLSWLANAVVCGAFGVMFPPLFIGVLVSFFQMFGRKVTINLKCEDSFVIVTESTKEADEFVGLVVNQLKKI